MASDGKMRTRLLDSLNTYEVAEFLERSDVIFLPIGTVEMHGQMPLAAEHVLPLAFAVRLAEECDGLVLGGLAYFYPGATAIGAGTITVSPSAGAAYLKEVCRSLLRQGFRRQVLLTAHGPAHVTMNVVVREFFDQTRCPIAYLDLCTHFARVEAKHPGGADFDKMIWGAYRLLGRLDEVQPRPVQRHTPLPEAVRRLYRSGALAGHYYSQVTQHGWWPEGEMDEPARQARSAEGIEHINRVVEQIDPRQIIETLRGLEGYLEEDVFPTYGDRLP